MSPSKREREYARRRYARYQQQLVAARAKRRKQRTVAAAILGVLVLVLGVTLAAQGLSVPPILIDESPALPMPHPDQLKATC